MKVAVIGAGSWGTAIAHLLGSAGHNVSIWARKPEVVNAVNANHRNPRYLSDHELSANVVATLSYRDCLSNARAIVVVTPSNLLRGVARALAPVASPDVPVIICSKGVEADSGMLAVDIFEQEMGNPDRFAVLSGPNHAEEVIRFLPSATVVASKSRKTAVFFQNLFATDHFRTYTSDDVVGVEVCAASKNVIAIAVGVSYGIGFGDNTAALIMTRGQAEMSRLVHALGGKAMTCMGLAGTGDLIATCTSQHSRNRKFGEMVAHGLTLDDFSNQTHMVAEGALACKTLLPLAQRTGVELPITEMVRQVVWEGRDAKEAALDLESRPLKDEFYGLP